jgi:hypothetical protein
MGQCFVSLLRDGMQHRRGAGAHSLLTPDAAAALATAPQEFRKPLTTSHQYGKRRQWPARAAQHSGGVAEACCRCLTRASLLIAWTDLLASCAGWGRNLERFGNLQLNLK